MKIVPYWIMGPWKGRLAILPRPRGGDWLEDEVLSWQAAGVDVVVSALQEDEITELDLTQEAAFCRSNGLESIAFPIADRGVPESFMATAELSRRLATLLGEGKNVAIHCRQGVGRSALLAACVLIVAGVDGPDAWKRIEVARNCPVPDTAEQKEWVTKFAPRATG